MTLAKNLKVKLALGLILAAGLFILVSCSGGGSSSSSSSGSTPVSNTMDAEVNSGPANNSVNILFVSVTICVPGSSTCQTIPDVQVDTGSEGLRLLSSVVSLSLPAVTDSSGNGLQECLSFLDGSYVWGPVVGADIQLAGEKAANVPIQLISASPAYPVPSSCATGSGALSDNTVAVLGANGIIGVGNFQQDCGSACTGSSVQPLYYLCPNSVCSIASVPVTSQLQNPVWLFPQDNNGLLITLQPLPTTPDTGAPTASGSLIFGIGTQSNNALGNAQIYTTDSNGYYTVSYNGNPYSGSFIDSGSNGLFFLDAATLGITDCTSSSATGFYCPASEISYRVTTTGLNGTSSTVTFNIANADALFTANNGANAAFDNLGGDNPGSFDFGLPFFYNRSVFVGIENMPGPNGSVGPYWAY